MKLGEDAMLVAVLDDAENPHGFSTTEDDGQLARVSATGTRSRSIHFALRHCCEIERRSVQAVEIAAFANQFRLKDEARQARQEEAHVGSATTPKMKWRAMKSRTILALAGCAGKMAGEVHLSPNQHIMFYCKPRIQGARSNLLWCMIVFLSRKCM